MSYLGWSGSEVGGVTNGSYYRVLFTYTLIVASIAMHRVRKAQALTKTRLGSQDV